MCLLPTFIHLLCLLWLQSVKVATALNWQMVCGCVSPENPMSGNFDPVRYNNSYATEFEAVRQNAMPFAAGFKVCWWIAVG